MASTAGRPAAPDRRRAAGRRDEPDAGLGFTIRMTVLSAVIGPVSCHRTPLGAVLVVAQARLASSRDAQNALWQA